MKQRRLIGNCVFLATLLLIGQRTVSAQECPIAVTLAPTKATYLQDDLLEVNLQFRNQGTTDELLKIVYPLLQNPRGVRLMFTPQGALVTSANMRVFDAGLTGDPMRVPAGRAISTKVYLQRFLDGFQPGRFDIPWEITVPCAGKPRPSTARGLLTINIVRGENPNLQSEFAALVTRAGTFDEEAARYFKSEALRSGPEPGPVYFTETPLRVPEAIEALRVATSPQVVPFLEQLAGVPDLYAQEVAFDALARFKANPGARRFVFQSLESPTKASHFALGLQVLTRWQELLPENDVRSLMNKQDTATKLSVLGYLGRSQHPGYTAILEEYSRDQNPNVAAEANRAATYLKR